MTAFKPLQGTLIDGEEALFCDITGAAARSGQRIEPLPYVIRSMLENLERQRALGTKDGASNADIAATAAFGANVGRGIPLNVERVILPDSSGLPVLQSLAALRDALARAGGDPAKVDTSVPVDLVVDHSLQVDESGSSQAIFTNLAREIERND